MLDEADLELLSEPASDFLEGRHGGVSVAVLESAEVRCFHPAAIGELLLGESFFYPCFNDLAHHIALRGLLLPFPGELFVLEGPLQMFSEITHFSTSSPFVSSLSAQSPSRGSSASF